MSISDTWMGRTSLEAGQGMLFVYAENRDVAFWMKNVTMSLDMIFIDHCGQIIQIHGNAQPDDETIVASNAPVRAVLELSGGASKRDQIRIGDRLKVGDLQMFDAC